MAEIVTMLALSPTMEEGHLVRWNKAEGDTVEEGEVIAEIETDKASMEMESFFEGTVLKLLYDVGSMIPVGAPIAIIGEEGEDISDVLDGGGSSDAAQEAPAPAAQEAPTPAAAAPAPAAPAADQGRVFSSPVARRIASENNVDLSTLAGSGPSGRIINRDVEEAIENRAAAPAPAPAAAAPVVAVAPAAPPAAGGQTVSLTPMRKTIASRMTASWTSAPHFALTTEIDMAATMELRKTLNAGLAAADAGLKLSVNDLIIKACAKALIQVPEMNVAWGGDHIVTYDEVHIGVAVAIDGGLITPVVRDAHTRSLGAISSAVRDLATRARDKKLMPHEYTGSTFSISNLGMFGITKFQAVLNPPEAGILAVGSVVKKAVVNDEGQIVPGLRMEVTLSCDHRSTDGAVGARFLQALKRLLENPATLMV